MITNSVRLGVFRDRPVFEAAEFGEIIVPAHIAAYAGDGLWGFLQGFAAEQSRRDRLFRYDPMTYLLYIPRRYWLRESAQDDQSDDDPVSPSDLKPALKAMLEAYELLEPAVLRSLTAARQEFVSNGAARCLRFQRRGSEAATSGTIAKYARLLGRSVDGVLAQSRLVAPYTAIEPWSGQGLVDQIALNTGTLDERQAGEAVWAVLALTGNMRPLSPADLDRLQLRSFDGVALWAGGMDEYSASSVTLRGYRQLISGLGMPVWLMFGGYFSLLLADDGAVDVSHGIYYTESKLVRGAVGGGPAPDRYYIPRLHRFYDPARAFAILRLLPEYECSCVECGDVETLESQLVAASRDTALRIAWTQRLQRHFLAARAQEVRAASSSERAALLQDLRTTVREIGSVPATRRSSAGLSDTHLQSWIEALE